MEEAIQSLFVGDVLYQLLERKATQETIEEMFLHFHQEILRFGNARGALTTTGKGAISALPTKEAILRLMEDSEKR